MTKKLSEFPDQESCACSTCVDACSHKPGWLAPGDAEVIAAHLGVSLEELFKTKLIVDWYGQGKNGDIFLLSPAKVGKAAGKMSGASPLGVCVFLKDNLCQIHAVKPTECKKSTHAVVGQDGDNSPMRGLHAAVATAWDTPENQKQIEDLLGEPPYAEDYSILDTLSWIRRSRW